MLPLERPQLDWRAAGGREAVGTGREAAGAGQEAACLVREAAGVVREAGEEWRGGEGANRGTGAPTQTVDTDCIHSCSCNNTILWLIDNLSVN